MMGMLARIGGPSSTNPHDTLEWSSKPTDSATRFTAETAFSAVLVNTVREAVGNALGHDVLEILTSKGLLDEAGNSREFDRKLHSLFGNGAAVLERIIVKDLNRRLGIRYDSEARFDYEKSLQTAKQVCFVESRLK
jgi:hypothetical protein